MFDIDFVAGEKIVHANHIVALLNQTIAEMAAEETTATSHQACFLHDLIPVRAYGPMLMTTLLFVHRILFANQQFVQPGGSSAPQPHEKNHRPNDRRENHACNGGH